jgi:hypothetical protein
MIVMDRRFNPYLLASPLICGIKSSRNGFEHNDSRAGGHELQKEQNRTSRAPPCREPHVSTGVYENGEAFSTPDGRDFY